MYTPHLSSQQLASSFHCFFPSPSLPTSQHPVLAHSSVRRVSDTFVLLAVQFFLLEPFSELPASGFLLCAPFPLSPFAPCCPLCLYPACAPEPSFSSPMSLTLLYIFCRMVLSWSTQPEPVVLHSLHQKCVVPFRTCPSLHFPHPPHRCSFHTVQPTLLFRAVFPQPGCQDSSLQGKALGCGHF